MRGAFDIIPLSASEYDGGLALRAVIFIVKVGVKAGVEEVKFVERLVKFLPKDSVVFIHRKIKAFWGKTRNDLESPAKTEVIRKKDVSSSIRQRTNCLLVTGIEGVMGGKPFGAAVIKIFFIIGATHDKRGARAVKGGEIFVGETPIVVPHHDALSAASGREWGKG